MEEKSMKRFLSALLAAFMALTMVSLAVSCTQAEDEVTLSGIAITTQPTKTTYFVGDKIDTTGMVVTATYSDASTKDVTASVKTAGFDSSAATDSQTVTVSYTEGDITQTATFSVKITSVTLSSIAITTAPTTTSYVIGEALDTTGMVVTATYSDASTKDVSANVTTSGFDSAAAAESQTVTVSYTEGDATQTATFNVAILTLSKIEITTQPTMITYMKGAKLDTTGMVVTATYSDGKTTRDVTKSVTTSGFDSSAAVASQTIVVSYTLSGVTQTATFTVVIKDVTLTKIEITTQPTKTSYYVGDEIDTTGMVVTATYSDASTSAVTGYTTTGFDSSAAVASQTVTVTYMEMTATFTVAIVAKPVTLSSIAITTAATKTAYLIGDTFDATGMVVTATYSDATTKDVTSSVTTTGFDSNNAATAQTITVSYTEGTVTQTATYAVSISAQAGTATTVAASGWTAWLGGEATQIKLTSATVGGTEKITDPVYIGASSDGPAYTLAWNAYDSFYGLADLGSSDFTLKYTFTEKSLGANNWNNWAFALTDGTNGIWYLRSDNWSNSTMSTYSNVSYKNTYTWDSFYKNNFEGKTLTLTVVKTDASIVATLNNGTEDIYTVTATPPTSTYTIGVGGESCYIDISSIKVNSTEKLTANQTIGTDNGDGTYTLAYAQDVQKLEGLSLADEWTVVYTFTQKSAYASNYHSYNFKITN